MKKNLIILIFIIISLTNARAMDFGKESDLSKFSSPPNQNINHTTPLPQSMIKTISNELNAHIPQGILFKKSPQELTPQEYQSLAARVEQICPTISDPLIVELVQKNSYFHASLRYFINMALKNLEQVTCATLDIVRDSHNQQPIPELNRLSPVLKKYVMDYAYGEIKYKHTIHFKGHTNPVCCIDINKPYAASSCTQGICKIWDIRTGKEKYTLATEKKYGWVKFNQNSSLLATVLMPHKSDTLTIIHIWKIDPAASPEKPYYSIDHSHSRALSKICFLGNNICIFETYGMTQYKLKKDGTIIKLGTVHCKNIGYDEDSPYPTQRDIRDNSWSLTKTSALLYLCKQAVINTQLTDNIPFIIHRTTYQELWPHEQDTLTQYMQKPKEI